MRFIIMSFLVGALNYRGVPGSEVYFDDQIHSGNIERYIRSDVTYDEVRSYVAKHGKNPRYAIVFLYHNLRCKIGFRTPMLYAKENAITSNPTLFSSLQMPQLAALSNEEAILYLIKLLNLLHQYPHPMDTSRIDDATAQTQAMEGSLLWDFAIRNLAIRGLFSPWVPRLPFLYAVSGNKLVHVDLTTVVSGDLSDETIHAFVSNSEFDCNFHIVRASTMLSEKVRSFPQLNVITKNDWLKHKLIDLPRLDRFTDRTALGYLKLTLIVIKEISAPKNPLLTIPDLLASSVLQLISENFILSEVSTPEQPILEDNIARLIFNFEQRRSSLYTDMLRNALELVNTRGENPDSQYLLEAALHMVIGLHFNFGLQYLRTVTEQSATFINSALQLVNTSRSIESLKPTIETIRDLFLFGIWNGDDYNREHYLPDKVGELIANSLKNI